MVYYRLKEKDERYIRYEYFPEKDMECEPGIILVDTIDETVTIEKVAELRYTSHANHTIRDLVRKLNADIIPDEGMAAWY